MHLCDRKELMPNSPAVCMQASLPSAECQSHLYGVQRANHLHFKIGKLGKVTRIISCSVQWNLIAWGSKNQNHLTLCCQTVISEEMKHSSTDLTKRAHLKS